MFVLGNTNNFWMETKHNTKTFSMACEILKSLVGTMNSILLLAWKIAILLEIKQTKEWGGDVVNNNILHENTWQIKNNDVG
jgi:hypothetical protein